MTNKILILIRYCALIGLIWPFFDTFAQSETTSLINQYAVKKLTADDGFVSSEIYSIIQDNQGFLWFGTAENGVMRYDGRKVKLFEFDKLSSNGLSHNDAGNLMLDQQGKIWIGTWGGGANTYEPKTGKFDNFIYQSNQASSISSHRIQSLLHDQTGTIWLGSYDGGLNRYLGNSQFEHFKNKNNSESSLSHNRVWDIKDRDKHHLWVATSYGLNLFNKQNKSFKHYFPEPDNKTPTGANEIRSLLITDNKQMLVATQKGPFYFNPNNGVFTPILANDKTYLGQVNSMIEDRDGFIWFVTTKGIYRYNSDVKFLQKLALGYDNGFRVIFEDQFGVIWITNEVQGIFKLTPQRRFKSINSEKLSAPNGMAINKSGDVLIASSSSALFKWHIATEQLERLSPSIFNKIRGFNLNDATEKPVIVQQNDQVIWIAQDNGLAKFNLQTKKSELISYPKNVKGHQQFREFRALALDKDAVLWIGTYKNGIYLYNTVTKIFQYLDKSSGLSHPEILKIFIDKDNNIWVGTGDGVNLWLADEQRFHAFKMDEAKEGSLLGSIVQDIYQAQNGAIWIATQKGLNLFQPNTKTFKHFNGLNGLPTSLIRAVVDDSEGNLWLTTNKGISTLNPNTEEVINYGGREGLLGSNYYANSLVIGANKTLFTSSQRGIEYFNTELKDEQAHSPFVVLTGFSKMGQQYKLDKPYPYVTDIDLSHQDYFVSFEFSVLDFGFSKNHQYAYKLQGYDENWIDLGSNNRASFTSLKGGQYTLLVKATNSLGEWSDKQLAIALNVSPSPFNTWWAYFIYICATVFIVFIVTYLRTRLQQTEISKQKQFVLALEEQVNEKTASLEQYAEQLKKALKYAEETTKLKSEFLANMSHEIRTPMNGVLGMLQLLKDSQLSSEQAHRVSIASSSAQSLLILINDILDFSKIEADRLELEYIDFDIRQLLEKLVESIALEAQLKQVEIILDISAINVSSINSDPGRIRQIITNILSNAVKFTDNGQITIVAALSPSNKRGFYLLQCTITDTGIGISQQKLPLLFDAFSQGDTSTTRKYGGTGLGLSITRKLCKLLGGDVKASSEFGKGSCFEVTCMVKESTQSVSPYTSQLFSSRRILVADKNPTNCQVIQTQLEHLGAQVICCNSAEHLSQQLANTKNQFDIVLIDYRLYYAKSQQLNEKLIQQLSEYSSRTILMTAISDQVSTQNYKSLGIDACLSKPITPKGLKKIIERLITSSKGGYQYSDPVKQTEDDPRQIKLLQGKHVLLVEDNPVNQMVAVSILKNMGMTIDVAKNGLDALLKLKTAEHHQFYEIILMDCQMPEMDGYETTLRIRAGEASEQVADIPIIAMTANAMQGDKKKCFEVGMDDYISKPININSVAKTLKKWVKQSHNK